MAKEKTGKKTIRGKDLANLLKIIPGEYRALYPERFQKGYCPCMDLNMKHDRNCKGMLTVMDALKSKEISGLSERIITTSAVRKYKTGDVWVDDSSNIAYLYLGRSLWDEDFVLNLGGKTDKKGQIEKGYVNKRYDNELFFSRKVFPKD